MLEIKNLKVSVQDKEVLNNISIKFSPGKNYCIIGKNGSGKSSLAMAIMGNPKYHIDAGVLSIGKKNINDLSPNERAKLGIFLAFQHIPEIKGVKVFEFLRSIYDAKHGTTSSFLKFKTIIEPMITELKIDKEFLRRDLNVWFSGGERRRLEMLQVKLLEPTYIILDEIDSGLDIDALSSTATFLSSITNKKNCLIFITHIFKIVEHIKIDEVIVLEKWSIKTKGDRKIIEHIKEEWFN